MGSESADKEVVERVVQELEDIMNKLDVRKEVCGCCGCKAYNDWDLKHVRDALKSAVSKIERALFHMERRRKRLEGEHGPVSNREPS